MPSDILVRLVNVTKYFGDTSRARILHSKEKQVEVNQVTIHLYRGEMLGIVGITGSGKSVIGKLIAKVIEPSSGKVRNNASTFLASHNHLFAAHHSVSQLIEMTLLTYNIPFSDFNEKKQQILEFAELTNQEKSPFNDLTIAEKTQLLIALTYFLKPEVVIYDDLSRYLSSAFKEKLAMVVDLLLKEGKAIVMMEEQPDLVSKKANYVTWMSHGQVRKSGEPKEVLPLYADYVKQYHRLNNTNQAELFDLDYKMKRQVLSKSQALKRVNKNATAFFDESFKRLLVPSIMLLLFGLLMAVLIFNNVGIQTKSLTEDETNIVKSKKEQFEDKYAFAVVLKGSQPLTHHQQTVVSVPDGTLLELTGHNNKDYRVAYQKQSLITTQKNLLYINPAALYDSYEFNDLAPYMYGNYVNYHEFFNGFIGKPHSTINKELYPETKDRFKVKLTKNKIYLHFNDANRLNGLSFPIVDREKLKKKFKITDDQWIVKIGNGYAVADLAANQWHYYKM